MTDEPLHRAVRQAKRKRTLGPDARCSRCGADTPAAVQKRQRKDTSVLLCYECAAIERGASTIEEHHVLGRANDDTTIGLPGNVHREVSDRRYDWPERVRANPERDPLVWCVAICYAVRDLCACLAAWLDRVGQWLLALEEALSAALGATWWATLGIGLPWGETST